MFARKLLWSALLLAIVLGTPAFANHLADEGFDATVADLGTNGPWYQWGWAGFHPFGGNNPEWWGDSAAVYAGTTNGVPDTSGVFQPNFGTHQGLSMEGVEFELQVDLYPMLNYAALLTVGIQWRDEGGGDVDVISEDTVSFDLTDPLVDPPGVARGQYNTVTFTATAPAGAYFAVPFVQSSDVVETEITEHWCYIDNGILNVVDNLAENPGFEADDAVVDPWVMVGSNSLANWHGNPNNHMFWWADQLTASGMIYQPGICAAPGNTYEISITNSFQTDWFADLEFGFKWMAADDETEIAENATLLEPLGFPPIPYERYTFSATAPPAGTTYVRPFVRYSNVTYVPDPIEDNSAPTDNIVVLLTSGSPPDEDGDGVTDCYDVCPGTVLGAPVDETGRPLADLDGDCDVDLADYAIFAQSFSGPQ